MNDQRQTGDQHKPATDLSPLCWGRGAGGEGTPRGKILRCARRTPAGLRLPLAWVLVFFAVVFLVPQLNSILSAAEPTAAELEFFEKKIRPVLAAHCYKCHGAEKQKGSLRLDSRVSIIDGGDTGEAIVPGKPDESLLIEAVLYGDDGYQMPPSGKLPEEIIANLTKWVEMGAPWPKEAPPGVAQKEDFNLAERAQHWSFQPVHPVDPPAVHASDWPKSHTDRFILAALEAKGLKPAPAASRRTLIRRLSFALIGLPPTPEEVDAYLADSSPEATERVVDRLLASPHFGERWGRHWLDLVRFAESHGHEFDFPIHHAWRYRDYVIRALNADLPYNDFVREQIAGDLLENPRLHPTEQYNESILGTGFWYLGEATHAPVDVRGDEAGRVDNQIDVMTKTFLGVTVACARCHDHKFDAITMKDYYALAGFLQSSRRHEALLDPHGKIAQAAAELTTLRATADAEFAASFPAGDQRMVEEFSRYLTAALTNDSAALSEAENFDAALLTRWIDALQPTDNDQPTEPHFALKSFLKSRQSEQPPEFAAWLSNTAEELGQSHSASATRLNATELFADFSGDDYGDWFVTGPAFGSGPTGKQQWDATESAMTPAPAGVAHSGQLAGKLQGVLRSPTFEITGNRIYYRMAGKGGQIRLIIDGYYMDEFSQLLFTGMKFDVNTDGRYVWHEQNVGKYLGHKAYIEMIDHGEGYVAVDQIRVGHNQPPPQDGPDPVWIESLSHRNVDSPAAIADAFATRCRDALNRWRNGEADRHDEELLRWLTSRQLLKTESAKFAALEQRWRKTAQHVPTPLKALALTAGTPEDEAIHIRGSHKKLGATVPRRFLEAIGGPDQPPIPDACGRLELAEQIVDPQNPLTARVIVNRVWHHLFGRGIVGSVDNFGVLGQRPTHPELLDYLADEFVHDGWSLKRLIRRLVLSQTYQMSSSVTDQQAEEIDAGNLLLHRMRIHRLEGEAIRDAMLLISGRLDPTQFGESVPVHLTSFMEGRGRPKESGPLDGAGRRSIYGQIKRNFLSPMMLAFDTPIPFSTVGRRTESNVPAQALILMNDPFVKQQAKLWATRLLNTELKTDERINLMYEQAYARPATSEEIEAAEEFLTSQGASYDLTADEAQRDERAWSDLCHVLMTLKEFTFVE